MGRNAGGGCGRLAPLARYSGAGFFGIDADSLQPSPRVGIRWCWSGRCVSFCTSTGRRLWGCWLAV
jgi:hypothetical protein